MARLVSTSEVNEDADADQLPTPGTTAEIEAAHSALLVAYHDVLREASLLPRRGDGRGSSPREVHVVRALAHGHIRRRLGQLANVYGRAAAIRSDEDERKWFEEKKNACETFGHTLSVWWSPVVLAVVPIAIALVGLFDKISVDLRNPVVLVVAVMLMYVGYALFQLDVQFGRKRSLFGGECRNVYKLEADVFSRLGWGKPREFPLHRSPACPPKIARP